MSWKSVNTVVSNPPLPPRAAGNSSVTEAVVARALLAVGENRIGLAALFEALLGSRIVGIAVRMVLQSELTVSALDFLVIGGAPNSQHLVVIAFYVGSQNCLPLSEADYSPWDGEPPAPSPDEAAGPSAYSPAAVHRARGCLRLLRCPPSGSPDANSGRTARPAAGTGCTPNFASAS